MKRHFILFHFILSTGFGSWSAQAQGQSDHFVLPPGKAIYQPKEFAGQDWYGAGKNIMLMYARNLLDGANAPKFVAAPPTPVSVYENLKTNYEILAPKGWDIPEEVMALDNQWTYDN